MIERQKYIDKIIELLTFVKTKVELSNPVNLTDINIYSENFYRDFLNLLYGYNMENINIIEHNSAAIDLGDKTSKIAIQVTSTSDLNKVKKTVSAFIKKKLYEEYDRLLILNITTKLNYRISLVGDAGIYQLKTKDDIWDISTLVKEIGGLKLEKIKEFYVFLKKEIKFSEKPLLTNDMQTFESLIGYLSADAHPSAGNGYLEEPDPDGKINKRFVEHSGFLKKEYQDLYIEYGQVLTDVLKHSDIGNPRIRRLGLQLKTFSDKILNDCKGNAKEALVTLVEHYKSLLLENHVKCDEPAIRFFLVYQLIQCNVFPNKVENNE